MSNADHLRDTYARYSRRDFGIVDDTFAEDIAWQGTVEAVHAWRLDGKTLTTLREIADSMAFAVISGQIPAPA